MPSQTDGFMAALGMILLIFGVAVLIPGIQVNLQSPTSETFDQTLDERLVITGDVSSRVTSIKESQDEVNITLLDKKTGETNSTGTMSTGDKVNVTLEGENVTVSLIEIFGTDEIAVEYTYPLYVGWPDGANLIVQEAPLLIMLGMITLLVGLLMVIQGVFYR